MLLVNIDIRNRLINGQTGNIRQTEFPQGSVRKVYVNFSNEQTGLKPMRLSYFYADKMFGYLLKNVKLRFQ